MKILITHEIFPPDMSGGGEMLTAKIASTLIEKGHDVKILTSGNPRVKSYKNIPTTRIKTNRYLMNLQIKKILDESADVDLIHTSSGNMCFPSWVASELNNKPICCYVHHIHGPYWKDIRGHIVGSVFELLEKLFLTRDYDAIIFQNKTSMRMGSRMGIKKGRMHMIQPGIDYRKFQMNVKKKPFVLFVGNLDMNKSMCKTKGLEYLIEAAGYLPEVKFIVVGDGDYLSNMKKKSPSNVFFTGPLFGKQLIKLYNEAMLFCLPSLTEGFGLTILEAMASGCAVISTVDIGQTGILIKPKSVGQIKSAIEALLGNQSKTIKMGQKNRRLVKKFTWKRFFDDLIKIYGSITRK